MTLHEAQATFRQSPSRATALAYMDAAIKAFEALDTYAEVGSDASHRTFSGRMKEIRDWLMNERTLP
jgi:hypothetical protein